MAKFIFARCGNSPRVKVNVAKCKVINAIREEPDEDSPSRESESEASSSAKGRSETAETPEEEPIEEVPDDAFQKNEAEQTEDAGLPNAFSVTKKKKKKR